MAIPFDGFASAEIDAGETTLFVRHAGRGRALLLLHGFPETHLMWRDVAPALARRGAVVCVDLSELKAPIARTPGRRQESRRRRSRSGWIPSDHVGEVVDWVPELSLLSPGAIGWDPAMP